jgi:hypothetical protein
MSPAIWQFAVVVMSLVIQIAQERMSGDLGKKYDVDFSDESDEYSDESDGYRYVKLYYRITAEEYPIPDWSTSNQASYSFRLAIATLLLDRYGPQLPDTDRNKTFLREEQMIFGKVLSSTMTSNKWIYLIAEGRLPFDAATVQEFYEMRRVAEGKGQTKPPYYG